MKKILLLYIVFAFSVLGKCQEGQPNSYVTSNVINKFTGTWQWVNNTDTILIKLAKVRYYYKTPVNSSFDALLGCHAYIKRGNTLESSLNRYDTIVSINPRRNTIFLWDDDTDTLKANGTFKDITKGKRGELKLTYLPGNPPQIVWELRNTRGLSVTLPGDPTFDFNFTLPRYMILTKIQ